MIADWRWPLHVPLTVIWILSHSDVLFPPCFWLNLVLLGYGIAMIAISSFHCNSLMVKLWQPFLWFLLKVDSQDGWQHFATLCWLNLVLLRYISHTAGVDPGFAKSTNPNEWVPNLLLSQMFPKVAWKWREFGQDGGRGLQGKFYSKEFSIFLAKNLPLADILTNMCNNYWETSFCGCMLKG